MQNYPVDFLTKVLETYSPSGSEAGLAELLLDEMKRNRFEASRDRVGNVIGEAGNEGPRVLLCGHMDTVPGRLPVYVRDGHIHGRGAVDAKTSLAAMLIGCARALHNVKTPFRATIAGVVEEETTSKGIASIASGRDRYDLVVFGEPSGTSNIIVGYKGSLRFDIICRTHGGHSSSPWLSRNSLEEAFGFWETLRDTLLENNSPSKFDALTGSLVNATSTPGGNSIPAETKLEIDLRIPPGTSARQVIGNLEQFRAGYALGTAGAQFTLQFGDESKPFSGPSDSIGVRAYRYAIRKTTGNTVNLLRKTGTSDMNTLAQSSLAPMIAYGPGDSSLDHTELEKVAIADYLDSIAVHSSAIERFAVLATEPLATTTP